MKYISIFDIIGPSMIGPSSSHTAGAVRLGLLASKIYGKKPSKVKFTLYNSFAKTGKGHGTDKGLIGGILGFTVEDPDIRNAYSFAEKNNIIIEFLSKDDSSRHPNAVDIEFSGDEKLIVSGNSIGGGEIEITSIDDYKTSLRGDYATLILVHKDQPGMISKITGIIQQAGINIAALNCERKERGEEALMSIFLDSSLPPDLLNEIEKLSGIYAVKSFDALKR